MTPIEAAFLARLKRRARERTPELARRELAAYELVRQSLTEAELARAIRSGQLDRLILELLSNDRLDPSFARLRAHIDQMLADATHTEAMHSLPSPLRPQAFGVFNPLVVEAARILDTRVVEGLKNEVRQTVLQAAEAGLTAGKNPRAVARGIYDVIGLAPSHEAAVRNFRLQLESGDRAALARVLGRGQIRKPDGSTIVRKAHAGGQGLGKRELLVLDRLLGREQLSPAQIDRMTEAYRRRLLAWNAETHARTLALDAQKKASRLSWEDAIRRGVVDANRLVRTWITVGDDRVRPEHVALEGTQIHWGDLWPNGEDVPGDSTYNCRCVERVTLAVLAQRRAA